MGKGASRDRHALAQGRAALGAQLRARLTELEEAALARAYAISEPDETAHPEYSTGLRNAVTNALQYAFTAVEQGERYAPSTPPILLAQARLAARNGIALDAVLRRYFVGYTLVGSVITEEAARVGLLTTNDVNRIVADQAVLFERLIASVTTEYEAETEGLRRSTEDRRAERIRGLLSGDLLDTTEFSYEFDAWHIGISALGSKASAALRRLAQKLDCQLLQVRNRSGVVWAWLGRREKLSSSRFEQVCLSSWPSQTSMAIGEPSHGLSGWRLTHRQARAAMPLASTRPRNVVRYSDDALLASMLTDDLLIKSLFQIYLAPLADQPDSGRALRETLRAYFEASRNVSSTAAALGVSRKTVSKRLGLVEKLLNRNLESCAADLEGALRLDDSGDLRGDPVGSQSGYL